MDAMDDRTMRNNRRSLLYSLSHADRTRINARYEKIDPIMDRLESISFRIDRALKA